MGIFDSIARGLGSLSRLPDDQLRQQRETLRLEYVDCDDDARVAWLYDELGRYDHEMTRRANEAYKRENPDATTRHREHGWYLPNDD